MDIALAQKRMVMEQTTAVIDTKVSMRTVRSFMSRHAIAAFVFLGLSASAGFAVGAPPMSITVQYINEQFDGMESRYLQFSGNGFQARRFSGGDWVLASEPSPGASLSFYHRLVPDLAMDYSVFSSSDLFDELSESKLRAYVAKLSSQYKSRKLLMAEPGASKAPVGSMPLMGSSYWEIRYSLVDPVTKNHKAAVLEFVTVSSDGRNHRLRFTGPPESLEPMEATLRSELSRFMVE